MSLKTFESLKLKLTKDRCPFVVMVTGTSMEPVGFTQCSFDINGRSFTQKFIVCNNQRKMVSQVKVKLNPTKFSKAPAVHVKMIDSTQQVNYQ